MTSRTYNDIKTGHIKVNAAEELEEGEIQDVEEYYEDTVSEEMDKDDLKTSLVGGEDHWPASQGSPSKTTDTPSVNSCTCHLPPGRLPPHTRPTPPQDALHIWTTLQAEVG